MLISELSVRYVQPPPQCHIPQSNFPIHGHSIKSLAALRSQLQLVKFVGSLCPLVWMIVRVDQFL